MEGIKINIWGKNRLIIIRKGGARMVEESVVVSYSKHGKINKE